MPLPHMPAKEEILVQLQRLLASRFFSNSKRCPAMLSYVVTAVLNAQAGLLKERSLGIEVFHRPADYDTNADPIVRLAAGEIRKRLAQYYCEPEHEGELKISLPSGSYVPEFRRPELSQTDHVSSPSVEIAPEINCSPARHASWRLIYYLSAAVVLVITGFLTLPHLFARSYSNEFWGAVINSHSPVLITVGQPDRMAGETAYKKALDETNLGLRALMLDHVTMADAIAASRVSGFLGRSGVLSFLQGSDSTTFTDLQNGPVVLVSGANNAWTMRATKNLRFHFEWKMVGDRPIVWVADRKKPDQQSWQVDFHSTYTALSQDFALVGRFNDPSTGQITVVAAGISANGTLSASECITDAKCLRAIYDHDPAKGRARNIEAVLSTQVIDGKSGPPVVLAVHSW